MPLPLQCELTKLERYLAGSTTPAEQLDIERHLDSCLDCRRKLDALAGDEAFWSAATAHLGQQAAAATAAMSSLTPIDPWVFWESNEQASTKLEGEPFAATRAYLEYWLEPSEMPGVIGCLAHYEVLAVIDRGGMGLVLKARDTQLDRQVAIKALSQHLSDSENARDRFHREAQVAAGLRHHNIIDIYAVSSWRGVPYLVMPFIEPGSLLTRAKTTRSFTVEEVLLVGEQLANGLAHAHSQQVVHRDIKPSNILLDGGLNRALIADFGLARALDDSPMTASGLIAGTPAFMSPEQSLGRSVAPSSDLFSLGSLLFWMATGKSPFESETCYGTIHKIVNDRHPSVQQLRTDFPEWFDSLLDILLTKDPSERSLSALHLRDILRQCLNHCQYPQENPLPLDLRLRTSKSNVQRRLSITTVAVTSCSVVALVAITVLVVTGPLRGRSGMFPGLDKETLASELDANHDQPEKEDAGLPDVNTDQKMQGANQTESHALAEQSSAPGTNGEKADARTADLPNAEAFQRVRTRSGPLDELDLVNALAELPKGIETAYWLNRLKALAPHDIPPELLPSLQSLATSTNEHDSKLATEILSKDPFIPVESDGPLTSPPTPSLLD